VKITRVETFVVKIPHHDRFGGQTEPPRTFPGSEYYFEKEWNEAYADKVQSLLVRVETDEGLHGWGEGQAPVVPEAARELIDRLLGPMLVGSDPRETNVLWERMYRSMHVRGQVTGFMLDAISGLDVALWDLKGKAAGEPVCRLLGGPFCDRLPAYVSGLRAPTMEARAELAQKYYEEGYPAVKLFLGRGVEEDVANVRSVRERVGGDRRLLSDQFWMYTLPEAERLGRALEDLGVEWMEAPMPPEDVHGHARLAGALEMAVAVGEPLRTRYQFREWIERRALDIAQPDIARCGITEGRRIADLAATYHLPVAYHVGVCLGVAMAATWHLAAATPNFIIQEHEPPMFDLSNRLFKEPLRVEEGHAVVPEGPGLGVEVEMEALRRWTAT
jgi:L-alanine-DL-glutamate epimerase-like enolase superfamily enzyme